MQRAGRPSSPLDAADHSTKKAYRLFPGGSPPDHVSDLAEAAASPRRRRRSSSLDDLQNSINASRHARTASKRSRHSTSTVFEAADSPTVPKRFTFKSELTATSDDARTIGGLSDLHSETIPVATQMPSGRSVKSTTATTELLRSFSPGQDNESMPKKPRGRNSPKPNLQIDIKKTKKSAARSGSDDDRPPPPPPKDSPRDGPTSPRQANLTKSTRSSWSSASIHESSPVVLQSIGTKPTYVTHASAASAISKSVHGKTTTSSSPSTEPSPAPTEKKRIARKPIGPKKAAAERKAAAALEEPTTHTNESKSHSRPVSSKSPRVRPARGPVGLGIGIETDRPLLLLRNDQPGSPASVRRPKTAPNSRQRSPGGRSVKSRRREHPELPDLGVRSRHASRARSQSNNDLKLRPDIQPSFSSDVPFGYSVQVTAASGGRDQRAKREKPLVSPATRGSKSKPDMNDRDQTSMSRIKAMARRRSPSPNEANARSDTRPTSPNSNDLRPKRDLSHVVSPMLKDFDYEENSPISPLIVDFRVNQTAPLPSPLTGELVFKERSGSEIKPKHDTRLKSPSKNKLNANSKPAESSDDDLPPPPPLKDFPPTPQSTQFAKSTKPTERLRTPNGDQKLSVESPGRDTVRFDLNARAFSPNNENDRPNTRGSDSTSPQGKSKLREWATRPPSSHGPQYICHQMFSKMPQRRNSKSMGRRLSLRTRPVTPDPEKGPPPRVMSPGAIVEGSSEWDESDRNISRREPVTMLNWGRKTKQRQSDRPMTPEISVRPPPGQLLATKAVSLVRPTSPIVTPVTTAINEVSGTAEESEGQNSAKKPSRKSELAPEVVNWTMPPEGPPRLAWTPPSANLESPHLYEVSTTSTSLESLALKSHPPTMRSKTSSIDPASSEAIRTMNAAFEPVESLPAPRMARVKPSTSQQRVQASRTKIRMDKLKAQTARQAESSSIQPERSEPTSKQTTVESARSSSRSEDRPSSRLDSIGPRDVLDAAAQLRTRMRNLELGHRPTTPEVIASHAMETVSPSQERARSVTPTRPDILEALSKESDALYERYAALRSERQILSNAIIAALKKQNPGPGHANDLLDQHLALNSINSSMNICFAKLKSLDYRKEEATTKEISILNTKVRLAEGMSQRPSLRFSSSRLTDTGLTALSEESEKLMSRRTLSQGSVPRISIDVARQLLDTKERTAAIAQENRSTRETPRSSPIDATKPQISESTKTEVTPKSSAEVVRRPVFLRTTSKEAPELVVDPVDIPVTPKLANKETPNVVVELGQLSAAPKSESHRNPELVIETVNGANSSKGTSKDTSPASAQTTDSSLIPLRLAAKATASKRSSAMPETRTPKIEQSESPATQSELMDVVDSTIPKTDLSKGATKGRKDSFRSETPKLESARPSNDSAASDERLQNTESLKPIESAPTDESEEEPTKPKKIRIRSAKAASILARMGRPMTGRLDATEMIAPIKMEKERTPKTASKSKPDMHIQVSDIKSSASGWLAQLSPIPKSPYPQSAKTPTQAQAKSRRNSSDSDASATTVVRDVRSSNRNTQIPAMPVLTPSDADVSNSEVPPPPLPAKSTTSETWTEPPQLPQNKTSTSVPRKVANLAKKFEAASSDSGSSRSTPTGYSFPNPPSTASAQSSISTASTAPSYDMRANKPWITNTPPTHSNEEPAPPPRTNARGTTVPRLDVSSNSSARSTPVEEPEATTPRVEKISEARALRVVTKGSGKAVQIVADDDDVLDYYTTESEDM